MHWSAGTVTADDDLDPRQALSAYLLARPHPLPEMRLDARHAHLDAACESRSVAETGVSNRLLGSAETSRATALAILPDGRLELWNEMGTSAQLERGWRFRTTAARS